MSDRRVRDALQKLNKLASRSSNVAGTEAVKELPNYTKRIVRQRLHHKRVALTTQMMKLNEDNITSDDAEGLKSFFSKQFIIISRSHPAEAFRLLGELVAYIVEIKLENTTSTSPARLPTSHEGDFELWALVLDRGILSAVQVCEGEPFPYGFS